MVADVFRRLGAGVKTGSALSRQPRAKMDNDDLTPSCTIIIVISIEGR